MRLERFGPAAPRESCRVLEWAIPVLTVGALELPDSAEVVADLTNREVGRCFEGAGIAFGLGEQQSAL